MKILHLIYDHIKNPWVGGGGAVRAYEIYRRLSEKNHEITVVSGKYPNSKNYLVNDNFRYIFLGCDKNYILSTFIYAIKAMEFLKRNYKDYDIIIEDFAPWNPLFSYKLQRKTNVILQVHHVEGLNIIRRYAFFGLPFYVLEKLYPGGFQHVIVVSEATRKKLKLNCTIISNGVEVKDLETNFFDRFHFKDEFVFFLGRIDFYNKGLDLLIKAAEDIKINLLISGKGKDEIKLRKIVQNSSYVHYLGFLDQIEKICLLKRSKIVIIPSRFEGQGIVALEAASLGKPIIVSDIPELRYVIENNFGIAFKKDNPEDLKRKIKYLWSNENLIKELGENGKRYAKNFTWDKIAERYENYLVNIIKKH